MQFDLIREENLLYLEIEEKDSKCFKISVIYLTDKPKAIKIKKITLKRVQTII